nr:MAG TPA: hypothetical protein [Caudoviricetes sp.]
MFVITLYFKCEIRNKVYSVYSLSFMVGLLLCYVGTLRCISPIYNNNTLNGVLSLLV